MLKLQKTLLLRSAFLALLLTCAFNASAANTWVQGGHSGGWVNVDEPFHGLFAEVITDPNSPTGLSVVIAWYAFINGNQTWIVGIGPVVQDGSDQTANLNAFVYEGNDFPPMYDPNLTMEIPWGTMSLYFDGCDEAVFSWDSALPGYGSGQMDLVRFTTIAGSVCDPDLGQDGSEPDDHGNFWQTATDFELPNVPVFAARRSGTIEFPADVDVFVFTVFNASSVTISTEGSTDTTGKLHELDGNLETELQFNDDDGMDDNFLIEAQLDPGIYTIHVRAATLSDSDTGKYLVKLVVANN